MRVDGRGPRQRELRSALLLSIVPGAMAILFGLLLLPRGAAPREVPLPLADRGRLAAIRSTDSSRAERAKRDRLPGPVLALGSALRAFHGLEAHGGDERELGTARHDIDVALVEAAGSGNDALLSLRATQLEGFLAEIRLFESTGKQSEELVALAGGFVRSMRREGWCKGNTLLADEFQLRAMFKEMWNGLTGLESKSPFELALDEQRALYALYLSRPHPSAAARDAIAEARKGARDESACRALDEAEQISAEKWRLDRIGRLASIDPQYPAAYARGIANFRSGQFAAAAESFADWVNEDPDGPYALRARAYLRSSMALTHTE